MSLVARRTLAVAVFGVAGSFAAFTIGANLGSRLERQTRSVSVGRVNVVELQTAVDAEPPPPETPVAQAK